MLYSENCGFRRSCFRCGISVDDCSHNILDWSADCRIKVVIYTLQSGLILAYGLFLILHRLDLSFSMSSQATRDTRSVDGYNLPVMQTHFFHEFLISENCLFQHKEEQT